MLNDDGDHSTRKRNSNDAYKQSSIIYRAIPKFIESKSGNRFSIIYQTNSHWYLEKPTKLMTPVNGTHALIINIDSTEHYMNYPPPFSSTRQIVSPDQSADKRSAPPDMFQHCVWHWRSFSAASKNSFALRSPIETQRIETKNSTKALTRSLFIFLVKTGLKPSARPLAY